MDLLTLLIILLVVAWAGGYWGPYHASLGPLVHVLLVVALVVLVLRLLKKI